LQLELVWVHLYPLPPAVAELRFRACPTHAQAQHPPTRACRGGSPTGVAHRRHHRRISTPGPRGSDTGEEVSASARRHAPLRPLQCPGERRNQPISLSAQSYSTAPSIFPCHKSHTHAFSLHVAAARSRTRPAVPRSLFNLTHARSTDEGGRNPEPRDELSQLLDQILSHNY
jgi:hypothetical protein